MTKTHVITEISSLTAQHFDQAVWHQHQAVTGTSGGRHTVWFVAPQRAIPHLASEHGQQWVLRHYYRGGLPGRFVRRSFVYTGLARTRSVAEYNLLQAMRVQELPVPKPIAALVQRMGVRYKASLLIERIPEAQDLGRLLLQQALTEQEWQHVGATVRRFHLAGVYHSDLNCKNILWRSVDKKTFVIDFDRCAMKAPVNKPNQVLAWQHANLQRLKRSFEKERNKARAEGGFHWQKSDWQAFMAGYLRTP